MASYFYPSHHALATTFVNTALPLLKDSTTFARVRSSTSPESDKDSLFVTTRPFAYTRERHGRIDAFRFSYTSTRHLNTTNTVFAAVSKSGDL